MIRARKYDEVASDAVVLRSVERKRLKKENLLRTKHFIGLLTKSRHRQDHLDYKSYLCFLILLQVPLHHIMLLFDLVLFYGAVLVLIVYIIVLLGIGISILMLFMFMGSYCRTSYIKYWQCVPLLKGAGYTIALMIITPEFINATAAGLSLLYIKEMFGENIPWQNCEFEGATNKCIPMFYENYLNSSGRTFSTLEYLRFNKLNQYLDNTTTDFGPIKTDWAIAAILTWILIFILMLQGFLNFQKKMWFLQIGSVICWALIFATTVFSYRGNYHTAGVLFHGINPLQEVTFWLCILMHVCDRSEPGNIILLSPLRLTDSLPDIEAVIVGTIKALIFTVLIVWVPILLQNVLNHYAYDKWDSIKITSFEFIFAVVPDVLSRLVIPKVWIFLWFLTIYIHCFSSVLYIYTGAIDSLIEAHPKLLIYRIHMCVLFSLMSMGINMIFVTRISMMLMRAWINYGMVVLRMIVLALITFALTFIYSTARLVNDYHFAYGEPPVNFWVQCWKVTPFLVLFETVFMLYHIEFSLNSLPTPSGLKLLSHATAMLMLLPIFCVMLWKYCKHVKYQMVSSIVQSETGWGYYNLLKRAARRRFNPQREVRYKSNKVKCKHRCLLRSKKLRRLQQTQNIRKSFFTDQMNV